MRRIAPTLVATLCLAALFSGQIAHAQAVAPPNSINFQARLTTPSGNPVPDGTFNVRFRFHDAVTAGNIVYEQNSVGVPVKNGIIAVLIAGFNANTFDRNLWLAIGLNGGADLTPRTAIVSVPYALKSTLALTVPNGSITNAKIAAGTLTADRLAPNILIPNTWLLGGNTGTNPATQFLGTADVQPLVFRTNGVERMRLLVDGSVGIGTSTPAADLHIKTTTNSAATLRLDAGTTPGQTAEVGFADRGTSFWGMGKTFDNDFYIGRVGVGRIFTIEQDTLNFGIGTLTPDYKLEVNGTVGATSFFTTSDARYKTHVAPLDNALDTLLNLRGVSYEWNKAACPNHRFGEGRQIGFIAQELEQIPPQLVKTKSDGYKAVNYMGVVPILVEAVKTLKKDNDGKQQQIDALKATLTDVLKRLDAMEGKH